MDNPVCIFEWGESSSLSLSRFLIISCHFQSFSLSLGGVGGGGVGRCQSAHGGGGGMRRQRAATTRLVATRKMMVSRRERAASDFDSPSASSE